MGFGSINNIYLYDICLFLHCLDTAALSCTLPEEIHILFLNTDYGLFITEQLLLSLERTLDLSTKDYVLLYGYNLQVYTDQTALAMELSSDHDVGWLLYRLWSAVCVEQWVSRQHG